MPRRKKCPVDIQKELDAAVSSSSSFHSMLHHLSKKPCDNAFKEYYRSYSNSHYEIFKYMQEAIHKLADQPLFIAFFTFVKENLSDQEIENNAHMLIKEDILPSLDDKGRIFSIESLREFEHKKIFDKIRSRRDLSLECRESLVSIYIRFSKWLELETFNFVSRAFDPVQLKSQRKAIVYSMFIKLLTHLDEKAQLVAKLLYFGGSRILDEVLSLDLRDVDFKTCTIRFGSCRVSYPSHILGDIAEIAQGRSSGRVFLGRQNAPLNPTTIFRKFKEAGSRVGLGDSVSPKSLTASL